MAQFAEDNLKTRHMVLSWDFLHLALITITFLFYNMFMMGAYKNYALKNGVTDDHFLSFIGSCAYFTNCCS